ncbi:response regulator transcription factor [Candidatus Cyanaurora vandensis]|uniref:response regulator transcription factor n=1 Tax=Candidatus Cyanaurora vandensis TaxID=2714958 RepID=UPI00257F8522|nr:response regulator [Candidatus Cyanaurora vandensis]
MRREKVLLIEKHEYYRLRFAQGLASQGYEVVCYTSARDFDECIQRETPYLLMLDMGQNGINPYDICRHCQDFYPWMPILLTVERREPIEPLERRWAINQGATDILVKRVNQLEVLLQRVHDLLRPGTQVNQQALLSSHTVEAPAVVHEN